ncbi:hypothetical protein H4219_005691 [Mycoemilia scoparia]|uniref:polynucleotide adenylyltransferase n=1 Tax=Mycoemilia scoparia TaxID=417184 RepID=A0A9W7ZLX4_9FUNG|nr:hypothetical protein H4219_005691 [Mycoemilia scoparia]
MGEIDDSADFVGFVSSPSEHSLSNDEGSVVTISDSESYSSYDSQDYSDFNSDEGIIDREQVGKEYSRSISNNTTISHGEEEQGRGGAAAAAAVKRKRKRSSSISSQQTDSSVVSMDQMSDSFNWTDEHNGTKKVGENGAGGSDREEGELVEDGEIINIPTTPNAANSKQSNEEGEVVVLSSDVAEKTPKKPKETPKGKNKKKTPKQSKVFEIPKRNDGEYKYCFDGQPLPPWLEGRKKLGISSEDNNARGRRMGSRNPVPDICKMLNEEVEAFVEYISPTAEEHQVREWVVLKLQRAMDRLFSPKEGKTAVVRVFGSFDTKLYLPTGDIDVTVLITNTKTGTKCLEYDEKVRIRKLLYKMAKILKQCGFCTNCEVIASARVPIIKTRERITNIAIDISVNADSGLGSADIVKDFAEKKFPGSLRAMVLVIKQFLLQREMNEVYTGGMSSYAVVLLLVSLLQMHPRIQSHEIDPASNLGILLCEFFELYGKRFNYEKVGISVIDNGSYFDKREYGFLQPRQPYLLTIEDPHDQTNDVTKGTFGIVRIRSTFGGAFDLLCNSIYTYHQVRSIGYALHEEYAVRDVMEKQGSSKKHRKMPSSMNSPNNKSYNSKPKTRYSRDPNAPVSFLSSILKVKNEVIKFRKKMAEIFYSNTFQNDLGVTFIPRFVSSLPPTTLPSELNSEQDDVANGTDGRNNNQNRGGAQQASSNSLYAKDMSDLSFSFGQNDTAQAFNNTHGHSNSNNNNNHHHHVTAMQAHQPNDEYDFYSDVEYDDNQYEPESDPAYISDSGSEEDSRYHQTAAPHMPNRGNYMHQGGRGGPHSQGNKNHPHQNHSQVGPTVNMVGNQNASDAILESVSKLNPLGFAYSIAAEAAAVAATTANPNSGMMLPAYPNNNNNQHSLPPTSRPYDKNGNKHGGSSNGVALPPSFVRPNGPQLTSATPPTNIVPANSIFNPFQKRNIMPHNHSGGPMQPRPPHPQQQHRHQQQRRQRAPPQMMMGGGGIPRPPPNQYSGGSGCSNPYMQTNKTKSRAPKNKSHTNTSKYNKNTNHSTATNGVNKKKGGKKKKKPVFQKPIPSPSNMTTMIFGVGTMS